MERTNKTSLGDQLLPFAFRHLGRIQLLQHQIRRSNSLKTVLPQTKPLIIEIRTGNVTRTKIPSLVSSCTLIRSGH